MAIFIITGARTGIGLEYAKQLTSDSSNTVLVIVRDLTGDISALRSLGSQCDGVLHILECDLSSEQSLSGLGARLDSLLGPESRVNVLINNAAILRCEDQTSLTVSGDAILSHVRTNVIGPAAVAQAVLPHLATGGIIVNITSGVGSMAMLTDGNIPAALTPYSISKTALNMLTVHQAQHLKGKAIVICVDPGHVKTEMGGPNAVVEIADSAKGVLSILKSLKPEDSGKFLLYNGKSLPW